jgi:DnaJ-class molecular chaperone
MKPAEEMEECPSCEGKGTEYYPTGLGIGSTIKCTDCGGKGELPVAEAQQVWERNRWRLYD